MNWFLLIFIDFFFSLKFIHLSACFWICGRKPENLGKTHRDRWENIETHHKKQPVSSFFPCGDSDYTDWANPHGMKFWPPPAFLWFSSCPCGTSFERGLFHSCTEQTCEHNLCWEGWKQWKFWNWSFRTSGKWHRRTTVFCKCWQEETRAICFTTSTKSTPWKLP